ncbi:MAG: hypothetical protein ACOY94_11195 [Bacillota bacterium]
MPLQNPMQKAIRNSLLGLILSVLIPALAHWLGADPVITWVFGGVAIFTFLLMLPIFYTTGKRHLREMQALVDGDHLVHWQLDPAEWQRFVEEDWVRQRREAITTPSWVGGAGLLVSVGIAWIAGEWSETSTWILGGMLIIAVPMGLFLYISARSVYTKRQQVPGEIYIGATGVLNSGNYHSWVGFGLSLTGVALEEGDPYSIRFEITSQGGGNSTTQQVRVPVPRGREEEAVRLVAQFHGEE